MDLTDTYKTFYSTLKEYTFFSSTCGTLFRINQMPGHKTNLNKFKKILKFFQVSFLTIIEQN